MKEELYMRGHSSDTMSWTWMLCVAHNERRTLHAWSFLWSYILSMNTRWWWFYRCGRSSVPLSWAWMQGDGDTSKRRKDFTRVVIPLILYPGHDCKVTAILHMWSFFWSYILDMIAKWLRFYTCGHSSDLIFWTWLQGDGDFTHVIIPLILYPGHDCKVTAILHVWPFLWSYILDMIVRWRRFYTCGHSSDPVSWVWMLGDSDTPQREKDFTHVAIHSMSEWYHVLDMNAKWR